MSTKRTLDNFFQPTTTKRARIDEPAIDQIESGQPPSQHITYPFPISNFPTAIEQILDSDVPASPGREINDQPHLDLLYFQPFIPKSIEDAVFQFLRRELFFYRVRYKIKRGSIETDINTPRYTTVFGVDETTKFGSAGQLIDNITQKPIPKDRYKTCKPRPIPACLDRLRRLTEIFTGCSYNFCLVNYYADGNDSISYHSDDERFLGPDPAIASFSLGATRDFLMKHKPVIPKQGEVMSDQDGNKARTPLKLPLASGDLVLMRGKSQANWLHSIPKRKGGDAGKGRINITFRKAMVEGGTENYYQYNVGSGEAYRWDHRSKQMKVWITNGTTSK